MKNDETIFDVSVVVCTYNPKMKALAMTIFSILKQKNIKYEIIVTDDGSKDNLFDEIEDIFKKYNFTDYKLIESKKNVGTVKNLWSGINNSSGKYIKIISPGDLLYYENCLFDWLNFVEMKNAIISFGDYYCYNYDMDLKKYNYYSNYRHPEFLKSYIQNKNDKSRALYLFMDDVVLGAATLVTKKFIMKYLEIILDKIIYGEDTIYKIAVFDGLKIEYFPQKVIWYEYGTGISTSLNSDIGVKVTKDWNNADLIIKNRDFDKNDKIAFEYHNYLNSFNSSYLNNKLNIIRFCPFIFPYLCIRKIKKILKLNQLKNIVPNELELKFFNSCLDKIG